MIKIHDSAHKLKIHSMDHNEICRAGTRSWTSRPAVWFNMLSSCSILRLNQHNREGERGKEIEEEREGGKGREGKGEEETAFEGCRKAIGGIAKAMGLYSIEIGALTKLYFFCFECIGRSW